MKRTYAWTGFGATFGPLILMSLFWKRMTAKRALAGIILGGLTVLLWKQMHDGIFELYEIVPGFLVSMVAIGITSLLDKRPSQQIIQDFDLI